MPKRIPLTAEEILKTFKRDSDGSPIANKWQWVALSLVQKEIEVYECRDWETFVSIRSFLEEWNYVVKDIRADYSDGISIVWPSAV
jgi:hypothetical protein